MTSFKGFDANQAIVSFLIREGAALSENIQDVMRDAIAGPDLLRAIVVSCESLYVERARLSTEGLDLLRRLANFIEKNNFHNMRDRARTIITIVERITFGGEKVSNEDPERLIDYVPEPQTPLR